MVYVRSLEKTTLNNPLTPYGNVGGFILHIPLDPYMRIISNNFAYKYLDGKLDLCYGFGIRVYLI